MRKTRWHRLSWDLAYISEADLLKTKAGLALALIDDAQSKGLKLDIDKLDLFEEPGLPFTDYAPVVRVVVQAPVLEGQ